ncbi:Dihydropteroate synthase [Lachnospiraceae bacterium RM5]|nr:Dihydropteroate synthase [Lachnospiraceae bacterium RM5]
MKIGNKNFELGNNHVYVMGILNVTPDSFSDGGKHNNRDTMLKAAEEMVKDGVDIIDIGGESTRPGYTMISNEEEIERVMPAIEIIKSNFDIPISLDTYKVDVAIPAISAGVDLINDIWGGKYLKGIENEKYKEDGMIGLVRDTNVAYCIMHNDENPMYTDVALDVKNDLLKTVEKCLACGIDKDKLMIDPGIGFAKTFEDNLKVLNRLDIYNDVDIPLLLGASRKSVIAKTLNTDVNNREEGTIAISVMAAEKKVKFVRVHNVLGNRRALDMVEKIMES